MNKVRILSLPVSSDYEPVNSVPLVLSAGSVAGDFQTLSIVIVDDAVVEGSEQFSLSIIDNVATAQPVLGRDIVTIAIIDNDFGTFACLNIISSHYYSHFVNTQRSMLALKV